jgi:short subunit dehydrogenase-like uncharacterized protein
MKRTAEFDIVVYGATGYTGRLVAEHLLGRYGIGGQLSWAIAGRSQDKLASVRDAIGAPAGLVLIQADTTNAASMRAMAGRARALITTVGPYQLHGEPLVAACAETGTDYLDLCGEPPWMRRMIDAYHERACATGARILFSCGFDSIPFELGVLKLQAEARRAFGAPAPRVIGRVQKMQGGFSGGTAASLSATLAAASADPKVAALLADPFALTPGFRGPDQPAGSALTYDERLGSWATPFIMAPINTRNIHRSNLLQGHAYGTGFIYDEMMSTGHGESGRALAEAIACAPSPLAAETAPKPGEGPSRAERDAGFYEVLFMAEDGAGGELRVLVTGDRDPGYGSTSKIIAETAICLLEASPPPSGGIWTPGAALGDQLINRLTARAGMTFELQAAAA